MGFLSPRSHLHVVAIAIVCICIPERSVQAHRFIHIPLQPNCTPFNVSERGKRLINWLIFGLTFAYAKRALQRWLSSVTSSTLPAKSWPSPPLHRQVNIPVGSNHLCRYGAYSYSWFGSYSSGVSWASRYQLIASLPPTMMPFDTPRNIFGR